MASLPDDRPARLNALLDDSLTFFLNSCDTIQALGANDRVKVDPSMVIAQRARKETGYAVAAQIWVRLGRED